MGETGEDRDRDERRRGSVSRPVRRREGAGGRRDDHGPDARQGHEVAPFRAAGRGRGAGGTVHRAHRGDQDPRSRRDPDGRRTPGLGPLTLVPTRVACLSPFDEATVRGMFQGRHDVEVVMVPDPPAQPAVAAACANADLVIADRRHKHRIDRAVLSGMSRCRLIQAAAVGFDTVDHRAAAELGIPVANAAGYNRDAVADWVIMAILNLIRQGSFADRQMRGGDWPFSRMRGRELGALTVGIIGLGNVGNAVATRLRAFGSAIMFTDVIPRSLPGGTAAPMDDLLAASDVVTVHVPLDRDTRGLIGDIQLQRMKPGAILINASRGPVVDEAALVRAL